VAKTKLKKFIQLDNFSNVIQPGDRYPVVDHALKGNWNTIHFKTNNPLTLEIGCGKGEYTIGLAKAFPEKNFIGIDIKGDRLWRGAKEATELGLENVAFLRIQAERINHFFARDEVSEVWLTFPDPQKEESRRRKRLSGPEFLQRFSKILSPQGVIHLKTDSRFLFDFTLQVIREHNHQLIEHTFDLYSVNNISQPGLKEIQTYYEQKYLQQGLPIHYLKFRLTHQK
jgi:tRNA (guanine-N7-)-methyltransferase